MEIIKQKESLSLSAMQGNNPDNFRLTVNQLVLKTVKLSGIKAMSDDDKNILGCDLTELVIRKYAFLKGSELRALFYNGVIGEYGEYKGLNIPTFRSWIESYLKSDERKMFLQQIISTTMQLSQEIQITKEQQEQLIRNSVNTSYGNYLKSFQESQKNEVRDVKSISIYIPVKDYGGVLKKRLVDDKKMRTDEELLSFYAKCRKNEIKRIYE